MKGTKASALDARAEVLRELAALRSRVDGAAEQYCLGVKAHIDEIVHQLRAEGAPGAGHVLPEPHSLERLGQKMNKLIQKPQKGKARELKKIQDLVDALAAAMRGSA